MGRQLEPGMFVLYHPEGKRSDYYAAFVLGLLGLEEEHVLLCIIKDRLTRQATQEECTAVDARSIRGGLVGFIGQHTTFGEGEVVHEELNKGLLCLTLARDGEFSDPLPITSVTLCCPCGSYA